MLAAEVARPREIAVRLHTDKPEIVDGPGTCYLERPAFSFSCCAVVIHNPQTHRALVLSLGTPHEILAAPHCDALDALLPNGYGTARVLGWADSADDGWQLQEVLTRLGFLTQQISIQRDSWDGQSVAI